MEVSPVRKPLALPVGVHLPRREEVAELAQVLARAFRDDPTHRWFFPSERAWRRGSARGFRLLLDDTLAQETVLTTDALEGAAIWNGPDSPSLGVLDRVRFGLRMLPPFGWRIPRAIRAFEAIERLHPPRPHWYLGVLGTDPPHQRRGVARCLIEPVLARADEDGLPAWLEASRPENVPYYERFGFAVTVEMDLPGGGPPIFGMLREPRSPLESGERAT